MGIKNPPKMTGKLGEYFEGLKKGKKIVPDEFQIHEDLDRYVQDSQMSGKFAKLTQPDKEYLLCIYFKFHLEADDKEEEGQWTCKAPNCKKDEVEAAIEGSLQLKE